MMLLGGKEPWPVFLAAVERLLAERAEWRFVLKGQGQPLQSQSAGHETATWLASSDFRLNKSPPLHLLHTNNARPQERDTTL